MDSKFNTLDQLREQIDRADQELLYILKRRFQTAKKIAKHKQKNNIKIIDSNRENDLIITIIAKARTMGLDDNFTRELFEIILDESKRIQEEEISSR